MDNREQETEKLTSEEVDAVANVLKRLKPGFLPLPIFLEVARLTVTPIVEVVPLRLGSGGKVEVLLTQREGNDPTWAGLLHTPGTVVRASDEEGGYKDAFKRIFEGELAGTTIIGEPVLVGGVLHKVKRGMEASQIYWAEVSGESRQGIFYPVDQLPENIIDAQVEFVRNAAKHYAEVKRVSF